MAYGQEYEVERSHDLCLWVQDGRILLEGWLGQGEGVNAYGCDVLLDIGYRCLVLAFGCGMYGTRTLEMNINC